MNIYKKLLFLVFAVTLTIVSCKKSGDDNAPTPIPETPPVSQGPLLLKITNQDIVFVYMETPFIEFTYDTNRKLKTIKYKGVNMQVAYGTNGKISSMTGTSTSGGEVSYTLTYSAQSKLVKVIHVFENPTDAGYTKTYEYNVDGKVSKTTKVNKVVAPGATDEVVTYEWIGNNITGLKFTNGKNSYENKFSNYDAATNPFTYAEGIISVLMDSEASQNNYKDYEYRSFGYIETTIGLYSFDSSKIVTKFQLANGLPPIYKFYYNY